MDIRIIDQGSIVQFLPLTKEGESFLRNDLETEGWQWLGRALCVDHRFAEDIIGLANNDGLEIGE